MKISFLGDVACDRPLLRAIEANPNALSTLGVYIRPLIAESDYVVANLETVFGGEALGYNPKAYTYNSPDCFLDALIESGISVFSLANNHCLDQGEIGLARTIQLLNERGVRFVGVGPADAPRHLVLEKDGVRVSLVAYTYGTNVRPSKHSSLQVSTLEKLPGHTGIREIIRSVIPVSALRSAKKYLRKLKGAPTLSIVTDEMTKERKELLRKTAIQNDYRLAAADADYTVVLPHMGGQFNINVGSYSLYLADLFEKVGYGAMVGNHPHVVQKVDSKNDFIGFYSLGGLVLSPSADYVVPGVGADYSIIAHLSITGSHHDPILSWSFSIIKAVEEANGTLSIVPVDVLYDLLDNNEDKLSLYSDVESIFHRVMGSGNDYPGLQREYLIGVN